VSRPEKQRERERRPKERTKENLEKPGKEREAWLCAHTRTLVRSLIIFPVAAEGKVAAAGCSQGEWKNIVISRRHTVFLLKQPPAILQAAAERHRHRRRRRENDDARVIAGRGGGMWTKRHTDL